MPTENNWIDRIGTLDDEPIETWNFFETALGAVDLEAKGYSNKTTSVKSTNLYEGKVDVDMRFYMFRDDAGALICFCGSHIVDGVYTPWVFATHRDHRRQGHAKRLGEYATAFRAEELGGPFPYVQAWGTVPVTDSQAAFVNNFMQNLRG